MRFLSYRGRITHLVYSPVVSHNNGPLMKPRESLREAIPHLGEAPIARSCSTPSRNAGSSASTGLVIGAKGEVTPRLCKAHRDTATRKLVSRYSGPGSSRPPRHDQPAPL